MGQNHANLRDLTVVENVSHTDTEVNTLSRIAARYPGRRCRPWPSRATSSSSPATSCTARTPTAQRPLPAGPGRPLRQRALLHHVGQPRAAEPANHLHILARGWTHLPFGLPRFGTPCAANQPRPAAPTAAEPMPTTMMAQEGHRRHGGAPQDPMRNDPTMMRAHDHDAVHPV